MNNLRQFCAGLILTLALAVSTYAGQIECPGVVGSPTTSTEAIAGEIPNNVESTDVVTEFLLYILSLI